MTSEYHDRLETLWEDADPYDDHDEAAEREQARVVPYDHARELYLSGGLNPGRGSQPSLGELSLSGEQRAADKLAKIQAGECFRCGSGRLDDTYTCQGCGKPANPESFQPKEAA